jgi:hypothetical protein
MEVEGHSKSKEKDSMAIETKPTSVLEKTRWVNCKDSDDMITY